MNNYVSVNFYELSVWRTVLLVGVLFASLLFANVLKRKLFTKSLIPNSVLGGCILLIISTICYYTSGDYLFNLPIFSEAGNGMSILEEITYHCLGIGFVAMTLRPSKAVKSKQNSADVFNSSLITIVNYTAQALTGMAITMIACGFVNKLAPGSGMLLCFGYGQGTGQALNIGKNFDAVVGGGSYANMGLSLAAMGFLVASIFGVLYLNILRKKGKLSENKSSDFFVSMDEIQGEDEIPMNESVDKMSIQVALVFVAYVLAYIMMYFIGKLAGGMIGTVYGFNFIFGVLAAVIIKNICNLFRKNGIMHHEYGNVYLLNRISGFCFDIMIVAGICAIQVNLIEDYIGTILVIGFAGAVVTFLYVRYICKKLFPGYEYEQFFAFFGMLTGTASTGMMLLREVDPNLKTPASDNLVYQNFPAIVMALPLLFMANDVTSNALSFGASLKEFCFAFAYFVILNIALFRSFIFKKKNKK